jgi:hypothetical protein
MKCTPVKEHLCAHLYGAAQPDALFALAAESDAWAKTRWRKEGTYQGYLNDLHLARGWAESDEGWNLGRQVRCMLIESTIWALGESPSIDDARGRAAIARFLARHWPDEFSTTTRFRVTTRLHL